MKRALSILATAALLGAISAPPALAGPSPTKEYCEDHKKKCKKNAKNQTGRTRVYASAGRDFPASTGDNLVATIDTDAAGRTTLSSDGDSDEVCGGAHEGELWLCNGGKPSKAGCLAITTVSEARGTVFGDLQYRLRHGTAWCWRKKSRIVHGGPKQLDQFSRMNNVAWYFEDEGPTGESLGHPWYSYFDNKPWSGHRKQYKRHLKSCVFFVDLCHNDYPYSRHYVHADGTWHVSGHNW